MMRRMLIIWKIVLVILVVLACVITGLYCCLVKASEADAELERFYNENMERKVERNAKRKIRHYNRGI